MLIKQTHFPLGSKGPNWGMIVLVAVVAIGAGYLIYQANKDSIINSKTKNDEQ